MNRKVLGVIAAVLLATVGTFILIAWVKAAEDRALAGEAVVDVLVARENIAEGSAASSLLEKVEVEQVPAKVQADGSVADLAELEGKVAAVDLLPGEQLVKARFTDPKILAQQQEVQVPDGLQEVTIGLEPQRVVGGDLQPGDTVGVFMSFNPFDVNDEVLEDGATAKKTPNETHLTLHKVLVTNVQMNAQASAPAPEPAPEDDGTESEQNRPEPPPSGSVLVTLALDAPSAEKLVFTAEFGRIWLSNEPATATEDGTAIQNRGTIYGE